MFKFLFKLKKPLFLTHFHNFGGKKCFSEKYGCHQKTSNEFPAPCQNSEKSNDPVSRKHLDRRQDRRTDRPYFIRTLPATVGSPTSTATG